MAKMQNHFTICLGVPFSRPPYVADFVFAREGRPLPYGVRTHFEHICRGQSRLTRIVQFAPLERENNVLPYRVGTHFKRIVGTGFACPCLVGMVGVLAPLFSRSGVLVKPPALQDLILHFAFCILHYFKSLPTASLKHLAFSR